MKKLKYLSIILIVLFCFSACSRVSPHTETVQFYYLRESIDYSQSMVLVSEQRTAEGATEELLTLYLQGPLSRKMKSPFPTGTSLDHCQSDGALLSVVLSDHLAELSGIELTIACSAIAKTCFSITNAQTITISTVSAALNGQSALYFTEDTLYP